MFIRFSEQAKVLIKAFISGNGLRRLQMRISEGKNILCLLFMTRCSLLFTAIICVFLPRARENANSTPL